MIVILISLIIFIVLFLILFIVFNFFSLTGILLEKNIKPFVRDPFDQLYQEGKIDYMEMVRLKRDRSSKL